MSYLFPCSFKCGFKAKTIRDVTRHQSDSHPTTQDFVVDGVIYNLLGPGGELRCPLGCTVKNTGVKPVFGGRSAGNNHFRNKHQELEVVLWKRAQGQLSLISFYTYLCSRRNPQMVRMAQHPMILVWVEMKVWPPVASKRTPLRSLVPVVSSRINNI